MFCTKCGTPLADDAKFCISCGTKVNSITESAPTVSEPIAENPQPEITSSVATTEPLVQPVINTVETAAEHQTVYTPPIQNTEPVYVAPPVANAPVYAQAQYTAPVQAAPKKKISKAWFLLLIIPVVAIFLVGAIIIGGIFIGGAIGKSTLQNDIERRWSRVENNDGTYYRLVLNIDEDEMDYRFEGTFYNESLAQFDYKVISSDKIEVTRNGNTSTISVEFSDDKKMMIFTPALTSTQSTEYWYDHN